MAFFPRSIEFLEKSTRVQKSISVILTTLSMAILYGLSKNYGHVLWYFIALPLASLFFSFACFSENPDSRNFFLVIGIVIYSIGLFIFGIDYTTALAQKNYFFGIPLLGAVLININALFHGIIKKPGKTLIYLEGGLLVFASLFIFDKWFLPALILLSYYQKITLLNIVRLQIEKVFAESQIHSISNPYEFSRLMKWYSEDFGKQDSQSGLFSSRSYETSTKPYPGEGVESIYSRLIEADKMLRDEMISKDEYDELRRKILNSHLD